MRWLAIDYGTRRLGFAVGDADSALVSPLEVFQCAEGDIDSAARKTLQVIDEYGAGGIVIGWPLNMDGSQGPQAELVRSFALALADRVQIDVRLWDERLSSSAADKKLSQTYTHKKKKARHDAIAAGVILEDFFAGNGQQNAVRPSDISNPVEED